MDIDAGRGLVLPRFVVFEGVDGSGKSTLARALARYYRSNAPDIELYEGAFPGSEPGTLGELVYRLHHGQFHDLSRDAVAPPALQLLHVAAHVDAIVTRIAPTFVAGCVILDRYWWSTYAYARRHLSTVQAWALVAAEHPFWQGLPDPEVIYLTRRTSLKEHEIDPVGHQELANHYQEVMERERAAGIRVHELANDGNLEEVWQTLLGVLRLRHQEM